MGDILFSRAARIRDGGPSVVANARNTSTQRTFEHSAAARVGQALDLFGIPSGARIGLLAEAEQMDDILNLNPGMLAGAQFFFFSTRNRQYSDESIRDLGPQIIKTLRASGLVGSREDGDLVYLVDFLRYVERVARARGHAEGLNI